jgi:transporter family protein
LLFAKTDIITWQIIVGTLIISSGVICISYFSQRNKNLNEKISTSQENKDENEEKREKKNFESKKNMIYGILLSFISAIFWGGTIFFTRLILLDPDVEVISMMAVRNGLMVAVAAVLVLVRAIIMKRNILKEMFPWKKETGILAVGGAVSWCGGGIQFFTAVRLIGAGISTPLSSISPFIVMLLSILFLKEKITLPQILGIFLIVTGSIVLTI